MPTYKTIYLFIFVTFVPQLACSLQLPAQQQQDLEITHQLQQEATCLSCIRSVSSAGIDLTKRCEGYYCGPYQISYQYWAEAGKPGSSQGTRDFEKCARDKQCAESTVRAYFKKFKRDCNNDGLVDCLDMAALHKAGPQSCALDWFYKSRYWQAFNKTTCATAPRDMGANFTATNRINNLDRHGNRQGQAPPHPAQVIMKNQTLTSECLDCICEALTSCSSAQSLSASNCGSGSVCGPFAISQQYWKDGRRPGASWTACARTKECSRHTISNYMEKYKRDCNGDGFVTCEDYAAIHRRGPKSCMNRDLLKEQFWTRFLACRANQKPINDANLVKVDEDDSVQQMLVESLIASRNASTTLPNAISGTSPASAASTTQQVAATPSSVGTPTASPPTLAQTSGNTKYHKDQVNKHQHHGPPSHSSVYNTRHDSSSMYEPSRFVSVSAPASTATSTSVSHIASSIAYEDLSPIMIGETTTTTRHQPAAISQAVQTARPTTASTSTSTTSTPTPQHTFSYESSVSQQPAKHRFTVSPHDMTSPAHAITRGPPAKQQHQEQQETTRVYQEYLESHTDVQQSQHQLPADYGSLPTIIVSKPLGAASSTSRVSQPPAPLPPVVYLSPAPQESYADSQTPSSAQSTTSLTTTVSPNSPGLSMTTLPSNYPASELETIAPTTTVAFASTPGADSTHASAHLAPEGSFGPESPIDSDSGAGLDSDGAAGSFDRVVNGIVTNPDFSKVYPPMPEHIQLRRQPPSRGPTSSAPKPAPQAGASLHSSSAATPPPRLNVGGGPQASSSAAPASTSNKRENSKTLSPSIYASPGVENSPAHQAGDAGGALLGPDALNMTSLFEKGALNETSKIPSECLDCICDASSNCDTTVQCISKQREKNRCGMYMISWNQFKESDISLTTLIPASSSSSSASSEHQSDDYEEKLYFDCSTDKNCAEKLIYLYIEKYSKDCNHDGKIDCYDIAAIHRVGPDHCNSHKFLGSQYWRDFNLCYPPDRPTTTTVGPQASSQGIS